MSPAFVIAPRGLGRLDVRLALVAAITVATLSWSIAWERGRTSEAREDAAWGAVAGRRRSELVRLLYLTQRLVDAKSVTKRDMFSDSVLVAMDEFEHALLELRDGSPALGLSQPTDMTVLHGIRRLNVRWRNHVKPHLRLVVYATRPEEEADRFNTLDLVGWRFYSGLDTLVAEQEASVADRLREQRGVALPLRGVAAVGLVLALLLVGDGLLRIRRLAKATQGLAGDLTRPVEIRGGDEIGVLAAALEGLRREVRASIERETRFFQVSRTLLAIIDYDGIFRRANPAWERITGLTADGLPGRSWAALVHPEDRDAVRAIGDAFAEGDPTPRDTEIRLVSAGGAVAYVAWSAVPSPAERLIYCVGHDVTDRKLAEAGARRADRTFEVLVESAPDAILLFGTDGTISLANTRASEVFGCDHRTLLGCDLAALISPAEQSGLMREINALFGTRTGHAETRRAFFQGRRRDGTHFPIELALSSVRHEDDARPSAGIAIIRDRSETESLESQLRQSQKMEAVGRLAGGIAHDFNNLLTVILANSSGDLAPETEEEAQSALAEIRSAAERAANLTRQLLSFSRKQVLQVAPVDLHHVVDDVVRLLTRLLGADIRLQVIKGASEATVVADVGQIEQALLNMAVNARDAMPNGGVLVFETGTERPTEDDATGTAWVRLSVRDTGHGMDEVTAQRVFEPFFTTKPAGKGTGLGLATVYGSIRQMGGTIEVQSRLGEGTVFHIRLPVSRLQLPGNGKHDAHSQARGSGTLLVVEDDPEVRPVTRRLLEGAGYRVIEAANGDEAVRAVLEQEGSVDLAVVDVVLEETTGPEVAARLREVSPELGLLFVSGYADTELVQHGILDAGHAFLSKPFTGRDLSARVREVLLGGRTTPAGPAGSRPPPLPAGGQKPGDPRGPSPSTQVWKRCTVRSS